MKLYRALRSNELSKLNKGLGLVAHCDNCKCKECILDKCCYINDRQHVSSGSKAKIKSRYISATAEESIAAWWCSNSDGNPKYNSKSAKSATYVELDIEYNPIKTIDTCERDYGATANNFARASCEVLIMDDVKMENITNIYRVKQIHKWEYDSLPNAYTKNGLFFKKMCDTIKKTKKYLLSFKIPKNNFNIEIDNFPKNYLLTDSYDTDHEITIGDTIDTDLESMDTDSELDSDSQEMYNDSQEMYNDSQEMYNDSQEGITDVDSDVEYIKPPPRNKTKKKTFKANRQTKKKLPINKTDKQIKPLELGKDINWYIQNLKNEGVRIQLNDIQNLKKSKKFNGTDIDMAKQLYHDVTETGTKEVNDINEDVEILREIQRLEEEQMKAEEESRMKEARKQNDMKQPEKRKRESDDTLWVYGDENSMTGRTFGNKIIRHAGKNALKQKKGSKKIMHKSTKLTRKRKTRKQKV